MSEIVIPAVCFQLKQLHPANIGYCIQLILNFTSLIHFIKRFKRVNKCDELFY